tara:strand:- start:613 stop:1095 length:483 start_codon:yes stop_codon:yes gene_type:complete
LNEYDKKLINKSLSNKKNNKKLLKKITLKDKKRIDKIFEIEHQKEFLNRNCLRCANCCKTTSPIFRDTDIKRISSFLKIKEHELINEKLVIDHENDYILKKSPCSFLNHDNTCSIYNVRPLACKEYPHTNRKKMHQIIDLTIKNSTICPAVSNIIANILK